MTTHTCHRCGRKRDERELCAIKNWPFTCRCGMAYASPEDIEGWSRYSRGAGDDVHDLIRKMGIKKKCGGCQKRQDWLNKLSKKLKRMMLAAAFWLHPR